MLIRTHAPWMWVGMAAASVPTLGLSGTFLYLMRQEGRDTWFVYLVMAPFLLAGMLLASFGMRAVLRIARNNVSTLWETTWTMTAAVIHPQLGLALELPLPATGLPSQMDRTGSGVQWQLNVFVPSQGTSEEPVFDLPVRA